MSSSRFVTDWHSLSPHHSRSTLLYLQRNFNEAHQYADKKKSMPFMLRARRLQSTNGRSPASLSVRIDRSSWSPSLPFYSQASTKVPHEASLDHPRHRWDATNSSNRTPTEDQCSCEHDRCFQDRRKWYLQQPVLQPIHNHVVNNVYSV